MKKFRYKWLSSCCLATIILFTLLRSLVIADEVAVYQRANYEDIQMELFQEGKFPAPEVVLASEELPAETEKDFKEYLHKSFLRFDKQIPIEQYGLSKNNVRRLMQDLINNNPELFIVSGKCSVEMAGDTVQSVEPVYVASSNELKAYHVEMERILGLVNRNWSDLEKLLFIHDYMASNYEYDLTKKRHSARELLLEHKGVCQAYMLAYLELIKELGIPVECATDISMNHAWNVVRLNGNWYHVDVTWDDPLVSGSDGFGAARHTHFLLSDVAIIAAHENTQTGTSRVCNDTRYDDYYWRDITAPFVWCDKKWYIFVYKDYEFEWNDKKYSLYYINSICECIPSIGIGKSVFDVKNLYYNASNIGSFNDKLYYLSDSGINAYDVKKAQRSLEYPNLNSPYQYFAIDGLNLNYKLENGNTGKFVFKDNDVVVKTFNDFEYLISPYYKTVTLLNYTGNVKNVVIPNTIEGYKVQKIADSLFEGHDEIESISIPDSVTSIGGSAFKECSHLKNITIPDNVTSIEDSLFEDCSSLESITIPDNVISIGERAFYRCSSLTSVTIPDQVTYVGWGGFVNCSKLNSITIGKDVNYIDDYAFYWCPSLTSVYYKGDVPEVGTNLYGVPDGYTPDTLISYYPRGNASWKAAIQNGKWQGRGTAAWDAPVPPKVSYKQKNNTLTLTFTGTLQESTDCKKWTAVSGSLGTYTVKTGKGQKFYRVVQ